MALAVVHGPWFMVYGSVVQVCRGKDFDPWPVVLVLIKSGSTLCRGHVFRTHMRGAIEKREIIDKRK